MIACILVGFIISMETLVLTPLPIILIIGGLRLGMRTGKQNHTDSLTVRNRRQRKDLGGWCAFVCAHVGWHAGTHSHTDRWARLPQYFWASFQVHHQQLAPICGVLWVPNNGSYVDRGSARDVHAHTHTYTQPGQHIKVHMENHVYISLDLWTQFPTGNKWPMWHNRGEYGKIQEQKPTSRFTLALHPNFHKVRSF